MNTLEPLHVEKHLLSLSTCGCYISTKDIVRLGAQLGIELAYKKRSLLLQTLFIHARSHQLMLELLEYLCTLLDAKAIALQSIIRHYAHMERLQSHFLFKIHATKLLLQRELALHVKESDGNN